MMVPTFRYETAHPHINQAAERAQKRLGEWKGRDYYRWRGKRVRRDDETLKSEKTTLKLKD